MIRRLVMLILCGAFLTALFGPGKGKKDPYILDGPGMINPASWESFTVSRSDSYAQHNFYIEVEMRNEGLAVTGEVRGDDGTLYEEEEGILLPEDASLAIHALMPAMLPVQQPAEDSDAGDLLFPDGLEALDMPVVRIEVVCSDGRILQCADEDSFSIKVYQIVMPYFTKGRN